MMTGAYDEIYLEDAMQGLGTAFDYAANGLCMDKDDFLTLFLHSGYAAAFGRGDPRVVAGMSGVELVDAVRCECGCAAEDREEDQEGSGEHYEAVHSGCDFWCGWILAYAQWKTGRSFGSIARILSMKDIEALYPVLHEAPEDKFVDVMEQRERSQTPPTNLQTLRKSLGLTQAELARRARVSLRAIQQYEERSKDINKAQAISLYRLAGELGCSMERLLEL